MRRASILTVLVASAALGSCSGDDGTPPVTFGRDGGDRDAPPPPPDDTGPGEDGGRRGTIAVEPTSGLFTTEGGGSAELTLRLGVAPSAGVSIELASSDPSEGTVAPEVVTFTPDDWESPRRVTVTGVDDAEVDGDVVYRVIITPAVSDDPAYDGLAGGDVPLTNRDDDGSAGGPILVVPTTGLSTSERGREATFEVSLEVMPTADVIIGLASSDETEGTVLPDRLRFTPLDWAAPRVVTVTGVDDDEADGAVAYEIRTAPAESDDPTYAGADAPDVVLVNVDDETAGITVEPLAGLVTTEGGETAELTIVLNDEPLGDVTIPLSSSDVTEGVVRPARVVFTPVNWASPVTVTVAGVDDPDVDGPQTYRVVTGAATSTDPSYDGVDADDAEVTNTDDETPGVTVRPATGLTTTERGGIAELTVVLDAPCSADVTLELSTSDPTEGTVNPSRLVFTATDWDAPQTVTLTGVDDDVADGDQAYRLVIGAATSTDAGYDGIDAADPEVTNIDDESPGITVAPVAGLRTTERGGTADLTVVLDSRPRADVTIDLTSSDTTEATVAPSRLTFTPVNWNAPQTVTVTGVDDAIADGDQPFVVRTAPATSTDTDYAGLDAANATGINDDDDSPGITVTPATITTTEAGGTATFRVVLDSAPSADVVVGLLSTDPSEGTVMPETLTFTRANWNAPQTVTVTGVDDRVADGNQRYFVVVGPASSADAGYAGLFGPNVAATNTDDDSPGISVTPTTGLMTTEAGGMATVTVSLNSEPTDDVTIDVSTSDDTEGTVMPDQLIFTRRDWMMGRTVTITGVDDSVADGNQPYRVVLAAAVSADPGYSGRNPADPMVTNVDDDSPGFVVTPTSLSTDESGAGASFSVRLTSEPTADVTIALSSSDTSEGTIGVTMLTFSPSSWSAPQDVAVTPENDAIADGDQPYTIVTGAAVSMDPGYAGRDPPNVMVVNHDDDTPGFRVEPTGGLLVGELGSTVTFTIELTSQPTADVTVGLSSSDPGEGTVMPSSVTFTSTTWDMAQTVTVTGVDDDIDDGDQTFTIRTAAATSSDAVYSGRNPPDVTVSCADDDTAGIGVDPILGLQTTEAGGTATFTIALFSQPTANVTIPFTSSDPTEATVSPPSVTFTTGNWAVAQTVTVTGVNDDVDDGEQTYTVMAGTITTTDPIYGAMTAPGPLGTNTDDDTAGIVVAPTFGLMTTEAGGTDTFTVVLTSEPTANVTLAISSGTPAEGTPSPTSLTFTPSNWSMARTVTVTGADDSIVDGDQLYSIVVGAASSTDPLYTGMDPEDPTVTNADND